HFGRGTQKFLERQEGLSFVILESTDVAADQAEFTAAEVAASDVLSFEREGRRPDGTPARIGFSLAFAHDVRAPEIGFAVCQHRYPENFWNDAFQRHRNGVSTVAGIVLVADNPSDHHIFLSAVTGVRELQATSGAIAAPTPRGEIKVMDPAAYRTRFGLAT